MLVLRTQIIQPIFLYEKRGAARVVVRLYELHFRRPIWRNSITSDDDVNRAILKRFFAFVEVSGADSLIRATNIASSVIKVFADLLSQPHFQRVVVPIKTGATLRTGVRNYGRRLPASQADIDFSNLLLCTAANWGRGGSGLVLSQTCTADISMYCR